VATPGVGVKVYINHGCGKPQSTYIGKMETNSYNSTTVATNFSQPILTDAMLSSIGGVIVLENLLAITILYRCKRLNFQIKILSMNLAISDISTGVILSCPLSVYQYGENCEFKKYLAFSVLNLSLFTVTMYNLARCFVFALGLKYYKYVTERRLICLCILFWVAGVITSYLMYYSENSPFKIGCGFMYELEKNIVSQSTKYFLLCTIISNFFMYLYLLRQIHKRKHQVGNVESNHAVRNEQTNIVKKISVITVTFLAIATPFYITLTFPILDYSTPFGKTTHNVCGILLCLNSAMNPVFYVWRLNEPRYHLKLLIMKWNKAYCEKITQEFNQTVASYQMTATSSSTPATNP
jgi:hypothetical protein